MGIYKLTIEPDEKVFTWAIFVDGRPIVNFNRDTEALLRLDPGEHRLTYEVRGSGGTLKIGTEPNPTFILPEDGEWPIAVEVPADSPFEYDAIYFKTGK